MARVKVGVTAHRRHKHILKLAKKQTANVGARTLVPPAASFAGDRYRLLPSEYT